MKVYDRLYVIDEEASTDAGGTTINNKAWLVMDKLSYQNKIKNVQNFGYFISFFL